MLPSWPQACVCIAFIAVLFSDFLSIILVVTQAGVHFLIMHLPVLQLLCETWYNLYGLCKTKLLASASYHAYPANQHTDTRVLYRCSCASVLYLSTRANAFISIRKHYK